MEANFKAYSMESSLDRLDEILGQPSGQFEESDSLPSREKLTFNNGFYAKCSAIFVDIRDSSSLPSKYKRPTLAKIYRAYISEMVAILNGNPDAREVNIVGDGVWAVFDTPYKRDIEGVFDAIARMNSLVKILNCKMAKREYSTPIRVGIGAAYGRALMIKAGYKGSAISDVVYMGDVVNRAAKCAAHGSSNWGVPAVVLDEDFACNLSEEHQGWFKAEYYNNWRTGNVVITEMEEWHEENCEH